MNHRHLIILVILLLACNAEASEDDLQRYLPPDQIHWLPVEGDSRYLSLYLPPMVNFSRGQLISLPDWHLHPLQSRLINKTYQSAPELGWHSWSLLPPELSLAAYQLQQPQSDSIFPQVVEDSFFKPYIDALAARLSRLQQEFVTEPGFTVWVMEGVTAAIGIKLISAQPQLMPDALVIIDAYLPQQQLNQQLSQQLAKLQLPVLELSTYAANDWVQQTQSLRHQLSQKHQQVNYRQRQLLSQGALAERELYSVLKGWLAYHGF